MKKLKKLKTGLISRNISFAKVLSKVGKDYYFSKKDQITDKVGEVLAKKVDFLISELGEMKGSFLKAGQMLSLYAQELVPKELAIVFEKLQSQTAYLDWEQIKKQIPNEVLEKINIEKKPFAAASIGQVHKAKDDSGNTFALKVQYKNVDKLIDTDLRILKLILSVLKVVPQSIDLEGVFSEIRKMLIQEMDYEQELKFMKDFGAKADKNFIIPTVYVEYSSKKVICTEFIDGETLTCFLEKATQEEKRQIAEKFFEVFLYEIFHWGILQSDAHMGNYLIKDGKWVLLDFGATKVLDKNVARMYQKMIVSLFEQDFEKVYKLIVEFGAINIEKSDIEFIEEYCRLVWEPLGNELYDWEKTTVSTQVINMAKESYSKVKFNYMPHENIFIDRKISGVYFMLKKIGVPLNLNKVFQKFKKEYNY